MTQLVEVDGGHIPAWAEAFAATAGVAAELARTPFVPASLRVDRDLPTTVANVAGAILTGAEVGMAPMASLRAIVVIQGTPAITALGLRAICQAHGHGVWVREATKTRAVVDGLRRGDDPGQVQRVTWTMDDARDRGLAQRPNWRTQPRNMLTARATAEVCRLIAADVVLGLPYVVEELEDPDAEPVSWDEAATAVPVPAKRTARRRTRQAELPTVDASASDGGQAPAPTAGPESPPVNPPRPLVDVPAGDTSTSGVTAPEVAPPAPPGPAGGQVVMMTDDQRRKLMATFRALGVDRPQRLEQVRAIISRPVDSARELTYGEAHQVLAELELRAARTAGVSHTEPSQEGSDYGPSEASLEDEPPTDDGTLGLV